ncbi:MAG TPA: MFS transporter, partial [Bacteroidetes bacterium]|nr:MFS transporter [Bacteroidota bacterium]
FLPIAIARFVGDPFGGWIYQTSKATGNPSMVWFSMIAIGITGTILMAIYNKVIAHQESKL